MVGCWISHWSISCWFVFLTWTIWYQYLYTKNYKAVYTYHRVLYCPESVNTKRENSMVYGVNFTQCICTGYCESWILSLLSFIMYILLTILKPSHWSMVTLWPFKANTSYSNIIIINQNYRTWNSSLPLAIFRPVFPIWLSKSNLLGHIYLLYISNGEAIDSL